MDGIEQSMITLNISQDPFNSTLQDMLRQRIYCIAPEFAINAAAMALKELVFQDGMQDLDSFQNNIQRVVHILYDDEQERQPEESRTLAHIAIRSCALVREINRAAAKELGDALVTRIQAVFI